MKRPKPTSGMRHVALYVADLAACETFYVDILGMSVEWRPDENNVYLSGGNDNLALHRRDGELGEGQRLDHIGFIIPEIDLVDEWHEFLQSHQVTMVNGPKTHRDGARSFYCLDPDGTTVQLIFHPPLCG